MFNIKIIIEFNYFTFYTFITNVKTKILASITFFFKEITLKILKNFLKRSSLVLWLDYQTLHCNFDSYGGNDIILFS